jgi:lipoprotein-anchoring transpeptidase ErfK/SrfK
MKREVWARYVLIAIGIYLCLFYGLFLLGKTSKTIPESNTFNSKVSYTYKQKITSKVATVDTVTPLVTGVCSDNSSKTIVVSKSKQHLWACENYKVMFDSPVTTAATANGNYTPTGSFAVYSKQASRYLNGSDSQGSWHDFVNYWMPFYGEYGFHDATWQTIPFGDLNSYTTQGSHGCVRLPLDAMGWLYNWSMVGTSVVIES